MQSIRNKNLLLRLAVAFTGGPLIFFSALYSELIFAVCMFTVAMICLNEVYSIGKNFGVSSYNIAGYFFGALLFVEIFYFHGSYTFLLLIAFAVFLSVRTLFTKSENSFLQVGYVYFWTIYIVCFLGTTILLRNDANRSSGFSGKIVGLLLLTVWLLDTFAYFGGRLLGRHKLAPVISPKKTIEGSVIGTAFAVITAVLYKFIVFTEFPVYHCIIIALLVSIFGQVGDLVESWLKRKAGVKDSSQILPGHGGLFDRFDSLVFSSPFVYVYVYFLIY